MDAARREAARNDYAWGVGALTWGIDEGWTLWCKSAAIEACLPVLRQLICVQRHVASDALRVDSLRRTS